MEVIDIIVNIGIACIPAIVSYFGARHKGKVDIKTLTENNKAEIERLAKQHEINIENLKESHRLEMEAKDKEHTHQIDLMEKEYALKLKEQEQSKTNELTYNFIDGFLKNPTEMMNKLNEIEQLSKN